MRYTIYNTYVIKRSTPSFLQIEFFVQIKESNKRRIGAKIATIKSVYELFRKGSGVIIAEAQRMTKTFIIFEPTTFQTAISGFHLRAAIIEVASSGILVPIATTVSPMIA